MDSDFNGEVSFNEFCELSEEKRRNLYQYTIDKKSEGAK